MAAETLRIDEIILTHDLQGREAMDDDHVEDIAEAVRKGKKIKRPLVAQVTDRDGKYYAIDQHRIKAWEAAGRKTIPVDLRKMTWAEARDLATSSNIEHNALKLTVRDKKRMVLLTLEDHPDWTDGRIGKHTGTHHSFVAGLRPSVETAAKTTARVGADNKVRKVRVAKSGAVAADRGKRSTRPEDAAPDQRHLFDWTLLDSHFGWCKRAPSTIADLVLSVEVERCGDDKEKYTFAKETLDGEKAKLQEHLNEAYKVFMAWKQRLHAKRPAKTT